MSQLEKLIEAGYVPVDLKAGNVQAEDQLVNRNGMFACLKKITKKGNYKVRFDVDHYGEPMTKFSSEEFEPLFLVKQKNMKPTLEQLIQSTTGMDPIQFEAYCDNNGIQTEWLEVCVSDLNDGFYNVTLPDYNNANAFASDGSVVKIESC